MELAPRTGPDEGHSANEYGANPTRRSSTTKSDPWSQPWRDPWAVSQHGSQRDESIDEQWREWQDSPEFSGEEDRLLEEKIEAWRQRVTRLKANKQALVLYNNLTGKAWRDAEDLDLSALDDPYGVDRYVAWITQRYLDKEVVKAGKYMSDFSTCLRRAQTRTSGITTASSTATWPGWGRSVAFFLDFAALGGTSTSCGWTTPPSWTFSPLWTTSMTLQEAAVAQDRMNRPIWENSRKPDGRNEKKSQQASYITELDDIPDIFRSTSTSWSTSSPTARRSQWGLSQWGLWECESQVQWCAQGKGDEPSQG